MSLVLSVARVVFVTGNLCSNREKPFPAPVLAFDSPARPSRAAKATVRRRSSAAVHFPRAQPRPSRTPSSHTEHARACDSTRSHRLSSRPPVVSKALGAPASAHAHARARSRKTDRHRGTVSFCPIARHLTARADHRGRPERLESIVSTERTLERVDFSERPHRHVSPPVIRQRQRARLEAPGCGDRRRYRRAHRGEGVSGSRH